MGYYTQYTLNVIGPKEVVFDTKSVIKHLRETNIEAKYALDEDGFTNEDTNTKWYSAIEDITEYSKLWPDCEFQLTGYGEENGDVWKKIVKNGKVIKSFRGVIKFVEEDE